MTACAFVPPKPNELMPARRGLPRFARPGRRAALNAERRAFEINQRIERLEADVGRQGLVPQGGQHFDDAGNAGGAFEMADVGFHRADAAASRRGVAPVPPPRCRNAAFSPAISMGSPSGVPGPWASM